MADLDTLPRVIDTTGAAPVFWDRDAVFVANLLAMFFGNREQTRMLAEEVGEVDSYGGRLLPILDLLFAGPGENLLVLEREPEPALRRYFAEVAGLSLPQVAVLSHRDYRAIGDWLGGTGEGEEAGLGAGAGGIAGLDRGAAEALAGLRNHTAPWVDGYVTDGVLQALARDSGKATFSTIRGSRTGNNKARLHEFLRDRGLPVAPTELAESPGEVPACLGRLARRGYSAGVVKAPLGASGIGMIKVDSLAGPGAEGVEVPEHFFREGPCLVQGWLQPGEFGVEWLRSPSVQLFLDEESVRLYDITEQILSNDSVHEGNESPPPYFGSEEAASWRAELLRQAGEAGSWLHSRGYRGTASADFLLLGKEDGTFEVQVCELNARVTGATYPSVLAKHFYPGGRWFLRNLRFGDPLPGGELLARLEKSGRLFSPETGEKGVLPVNFNAGDDGLVRKGQFLFLNPEREVDGNWPDFDVPGLPGIPDRD